MAAKVSEQELALFGGAPMFGRPITTGQLANRDPERFFALAAGAFERRWLTNQGPLVTELEAKLARLHGVPHCVAFANACLALILAIRALARPGARQVLMPALTFRGLPHLVRWAGLEPAYVDVDPVSHTITAETLGARIGPETAAVLAVDNTNALCDVAELVAIAGTVGAPLILDSVYGVRGVYADGAPVGARGSCAVFSLHATKLINGFEGGYLTTRDGDFADAMRRQRTFGFGANGSPQELGMNAKLNELHAAMALSNLPHVEAIAADNAERFEAYRSRLASIPWLSFADYSRSPGTYSLVLLKVADDAPFTRDELVRLLRAENALVRPYYAPPLHLTDPAPGQPLLPVSEALSRQHLQLPVGDLVTLDAIDRLGGLFERLDAGRASISQRLRAA